jgi:hypothetical protein
MRRLTLSRLTHIAALAATTSLACSCSPKQDAGGQQAAAVAQVQAAAVAQVQAAAAPQTQASSTSAQDGLHTIDNPGGGEVVYGTLTGQSSLSNAMVYMLRQVHGHFGDQPKIGKFFQSKGGDSVATFFTLTAKNQGNLAVAGLVIINMPKGATPTAAVLTDAPARFATTEPQMLAKLNAALTPATNATKSASTSTAAPPPQSAPAPTSVTLRSATAGDRSASIALAPGWQITAVTGGELTAAGPNGEQISLGLIYQGIQPSVCAYGGDVFQAYECEIGQLRRAKGLPAVTFKLTSTQKLAANQQEQSVVQAIFEMDLHDGKGMRKASARIGEMHFAGSPTWAMTLSGSNAPESVFAAQNPTIMAMVHTYKQNAGVVGQETQAVINNIHAIGAASAAQAQAADQRREASSAAYDSSMDAIDSQSKAFEDYTLDRSVVTDSGTGARGTVDNSYADSLVKANPNRFQIVSNQNLIKGQDY